MAGRCADRPVATTAWIRAAAEHSTALALRPPASAREIYRTLNRLTALTAPRSVGWAELAPRMGGRVPGEGPKSRGAVVTRLLIAATSRCAACADDHLDPESVHVPPLVGMNV